MRGFLRVLALAAMPLSPCHIEGLSEEVLSARQGDFAPFATLILETAASPAPGTTPP